MWPDAANTRELLLGAGKGDREAVDRLLARHREALRRLVEMRLDRAVRRRLDPSDIVQEALLEAHRRLPVYLRDPQAQPFHLWIRQIALDRLIDAHRRHRKAWKRSVDRERPLAAPSFADRSSIELASQLAAAEATPAAAAVQKELASRFTEALAELGEDDREVILLRHFEGLTNGEAARALGLTDAACGMRYLRALRRLRPLLERRPGP